MAQFENMRKVELKNGEPAVFSLRQLYYADVEANRIGAIVYMDGEPFALSGTCTGTAIRADGATVPMTGTVEGNQAYITLNADCYAVEGDIQIFVKLTTGTVTATLAAARGTVRLTETGAVIDPGEIIPSVSALIAAIDNAVASIPADYSDLLAAIAPDYADLTFPVTAGTWCWHEGGLYRAKVDIPSAESWTADHWASAPLSNALAGDVADLKSALNAYGTWSYPQFEAKWTNGNYLTTTGALAGSYNRHCYTEKYYPVFPGQQFYTTAVGTGSAAVAVYYDSDKNVVGYANRADSASNIITVPDNSDIVYARFSSEYRGYTRSVQQNIELDDGSEIAKAILERICIPASGWTYGGYLDAAGNVVSAPGTNARYTANYYPVYPGESLAVNAGGSSTSDVAVAYYDKEKQIISTVQGRVNGITVVPDDVVIRYARFSTSSVLGKNKEKAENVVTLRLDVENLADDLLVLELQNSFEYKIVWTDGGYININGTVTSNQDYEYTNDYIRVFGGQKLDIQLYAAGTSDVAIIFFDKYKEVINGSYLYSNFVEQTIEVPENAWYAKLSNKKENTIRYVRNHVTDNSEISTNYFVSDTDVANYDQTARTFVPVTNRIDHKYTGEVSPKKRYVAIGFDDLRGSDLSLIMPLFAKYGARAEFNMVTKESGKDIRITKGITQILGGNHELGDHTFLHYAFPYFNPLWNGQNPSSLDGSQTPCPTNNDFRAEYANGKNKLGYALTATVNIPAAGVSGVTWGNLTDAQCQAIREAYSVMKNSSMITLLDALSNKYFGTSGNSAGSWSNGEYTGGIFTGMKTSANHEVWERIMTLMQIILKEIYGVNYEMQTWSKPGTNEFDQFQDENGDMFYDSALSIPASPQSDITSSLYKTETGSDKARSWTDILREFGYTSSHDYPRLSFYPYMSRQYIMNANLSRKDAIPYATNQSISFATLQNEYPESSFVSGKTKAAQMYNKTGSFRTIIEKIRNNTANGMIHGEMIDSYDTYSFKVFWENVLRFCKAEGIEVITKAEAFDICFHHPIITGNLLYNPELKNSASDFFTDATSVPTNPDGYDGSCSVSADDNGIPILVTSGQTIYIHYGIPYGSLKFKCKAKGSGTITIRGAKNNNMMNGSLTSLTNLGSISISGDSFDEYELSFVVPKSTINNYDILYEGYGDRITGLLIVYSSGLEVKEQTLTLT